jgi:hypothetical protein
MPGLGVALLQMEVLSAIGSLFEQSILIDQNQSAYTLQVTLRKGLTRTIPVSCLENHRPVCQSTEVHLMCI